MSTTYHTPVAAKAPANASTFNTPLGQIDAAIDLIAGGGVPGTTALQLVETATPSAPSGTTHKLYVKSDGRLYTIDVGDSEAAVVEYPTRLLHFHDNSLVTVGNAIAVFIDALQMHCYLAEQTTAADADTFTFSGTLEAGTYSLDILGSTYDNRGIIDWYLDDVLIAAGQDWYAAAFNYNVTKTVSSITVAQGGNHVFKGVVNGKNGSSSDYTISLTKMVAHQAAD